MLKKLIFLTALHLIQSNAFSIQPRIIHGHLSRPGQFPSYVFFHTAGTNGTRVMGCGGALISDRYLIRLRSLIPCLWSHEKINLLLFLLHRWVVTAAHCLIHKDIIFLYNGQFSKAAFDQSERVEPSNQYSHPLFIDDKSYAHDFGSYSWISWILIPIHRKISSTSFFKTSHFWIPKGLIQLSGRTKFTKHIQPGKLPADCGKLSDFETVTVAGAGLTSFEQQNPDGALRHTDLFAIPQDQWINLLKFHAEADSLICAYSPSGKSICHGDSGGPLFRKSDKTLIGLISFIQDVRYKGSVVQLQAFAKITYFYEWISEITGIELPICWNNCLIELDILDSKGRRWRREGDILSIVFTLCSMNKSTLITMNINTLVIWL